MKNNVLGIKAPEKECTDKKCPFHGEINVKKELFRGKIVKKDLNHSATLEWFRPYYVPKYERYETRRSRMHVHNPACLNAAVGQEVLVAKTRPLSKTKTHVILQILSGASLDAELQKKTITKNQAKKKDKTEKENESSQE